MCKPDMHCIRDLGITNHTAGASAANKLSGPEHTEKFNADTHYNRLIHRRCASLDLELAFKEIKSIPKY